MEKTDELVELFRTMDLARLMVAKSVLDSAGLSYFVQGEDSLWRLGAGISGAFPIQTPISAIVFVHPEDLETAKTLLESPPRT